MTEQFIRGDGVNTPGINPETNSPGERNTPRQAAGYFIAGIVGAPFGLKGFVKVKPLSGEIDHLLRLTSARLRKGDDERLLNIEESSPLPPLLAMRFAGYHSPEAARDLSGAELLIDRKDAAPLLAGEFYIEDLKGLAVTDHTNEQILGHIVDVIEGGGGDLAEIQLHNGERKLVPFRKEFISAVDLDKKQVKLDNLWILE